jgi:hypothetical protein
MKKFLYIILGILYFSSVNAQKLQPYGRYLINNKQQVELISSAAHVGFSFEGKECSIEFLLPDPKAHSYIQYELDGRYQSRVRIENKKPFVIKTGRAGKHSVWIYKTTEAITGSVILESIKANNIEALKKPDAPTIEFIGNSITCGAAADPSEIPCGQGEYQDQHNAYFAYGPTVARALKVNYVVSGVSGIGIYRTWNKETPSMPLVYKNARFQVKDDESWDFSLFTPDIVSIALGTNDLSRGDGVNERPSFDSAQFVRKYISFVQSLKTLYPEAKIALLSSPMIKGDDRQLLQSCLTIIKSHVDALYPSSKPVETYFFKQMEPRGCTRHPSVEDHAILAEELKGFFEELLKDFYIDEEN